MSVLVTPTPIGLASTEAESLLSLLQRTADLYQVTFRRLIRLLVNTSDGRRVGHSSFSDIKAFLSQRTTVQRLTSSLSLLSGKSDGESIALLRMANAIGHGQGLIGSKMRLCPECLHPETGASYGMLAHQLGFVVHCPRHGCVLNEFCLACGSKFSLSRPIKSYRLCTTCNAELWTQRREEPQLTPYQAWCEKQLLRFVAYATNIEEQQPDESWAAAYSAALVRLLSADAGAYSYSEMVFIRDTTKRNSESPGNKPAMGTLLRLSSIQAVDLVSFIKAPLECSSPRLFNIGGAKDPGSGRKNIPEKKWQQMKIVVEQLLATSEDILLSSKKVLFRGTRLTPSGFWQHFPSLSVRYEQERGRREKLARETKYRQAFGAAERMVKLAERRGEDIQIRRDGAVLMASAGVSKAEAERALHAAKESRRIFITGTTQG